MKTIKLELDFMIGPIVKDVFSISKGTLVTGVPQIDENEAINKLNDRISSLYSSFYDFDGMSACSFNYQRAAENKNSLNELINDLIHKLNAVNDGSYVLDNKINVDF